MKRKRYSEEQIVRFVFTRNNRDIMPEVAKRHGVSEAPIYVCYVWRKRFGVIGNEEVKKLKSLEPENGMALLTK